MSLITEHKQAFADLSKDVLSYLRFLSGLGCKGVDCSRETLETIKSWDLDAIRFHLAACDRCIALDRCKMTIYGQGNSNAKLVFVGGAPEPEDELTGIPYSGEAGELLTKMIGAMNLNRESVYITYVVKCRFHEKPVSADENAKSCKRFLFQELDMIQPKMICALGDIAASVLLGAPAQVRRVRGRFHVFKKIKVMPTFSPEHLLKHPEDKRAAWADIQQMMRLYDFD